MATGKQVRAALENVTNARADAESKRSIAHLPKQTKTALGKQGAAVAKHRNLPGRSKIGRDELARKLGEK